MSKKTSDQIRDELIASVVKKRFANARAQQIVISLMEPNIEENTFLELLLHIGPHNYDDIVDERHIIKLCGYPLCSTPVEKVPSKQYHIDGIRNKVYDISERKKFCSGYCFKASEYIKSQVPTSPIWLRERESKPDFKLLPRSSS